MSDQASAAIADSDKTLIMRVPATTSEDIIRSQLMVMAARMVIEAIYQQGGKSLLFHTPREDMPFQQSHGELVCVVLVALDGKPLSAMPNQHTFPCFSYLNCTVMPVFTSAERASSFVIALKGNRFIIPPHELRVIKFTEQLMKWAREGAVVVNPPPELFMGTFPFFDEKNNKVAMYV